MCYRQGLIGEQENYLKLVIRNNKREIRLQFYRKPPLEIRQHIRFYNFKWSRKYAYWHARLNNSRINNIKKVFRLIYRQNNN